MKYRDYYQILNVARDASAEDIKRAYRKQARKYHPDVSKETNAEERFKELQEAYEVLKDKEKRKMYDQLGHNWKAGQEFRPPPNWNQSHGFGGGSGSFSQEEFGGFSDFFQNIFGGGFGGDFSGFGNGGRARGFKQKGQDEQAVLSLTLEEAQRGGIKTIQFQNGGSIKLNIPAGSLPGKRLRLAGKGSPGIHGAPNGDLYLDIQLVPHPIFQLDGKNIVRNVSIAPWEAALGARVPVSTLNKQIELTIPAGSKSGQKLRLKGEGIAGGDVLVTLMIQTPPAKTEEEREWYEKMKVAFSFNPR